MGRTGQLDGGLSAAPIFPICRVVAGGSPQAPIPDLFEFGDRQDADTALAAWAAASNISIDLARFATNAAGIQFI